MPSQENWRILIFGATGAIGGAVVKLARAKQWTVVAATRRPPADSASDGPDLRWVCYDPLRDNPAIALAGEDPFDAICWAHGANLVDSLADFDVARHLELYSTNCLSVMKSASDLLQCGLLSSAGARLTVVSSIWQERARQNKLSYTVTKAAVGGIVRAAAVDLGAEKHLVNGVLPGVLQTPMTEANLSPEQIDLIRGKTTVGRLPDLDTVAGMIVFLCSPENTSISGQSITVDLGMSNASLV